MADDELPLDPRRALHELAAEIAKVDALARKLRAKRRRIIVAWCDHDGITCAHVAREMGKHKQVVAQWMTPPKGER